MRYVPNHFNHHHHHPQEQADDVYSPHQPEYSLHRRQDASSHYHGLDPSAVSADASSSAEAGDAEAGVSVQFSPTEFLSATSRLAHLDLEGFERFVGNTFDRAIAGARAGRTKSADILDGSPPQMDSGGDGGGEPTVIVDGLERDTDTYVWRDSCRLLAIK